MSVIKAMCPACGDLELTAAQVRLVVCDLDDWSFYSFSCTVCNELIRKPADKEIIGVLQMGGVLAEMVEIPPEMLEEHTGAVITDDDCLDFKLALRGIHNLAGVLDTPQEAKERHLGKPLTEDDFIAFGLEAERWDSLSDRARTSPYIELFVVPEPVLRTGPRRSRFQP